MSRKLRGSLVEGLETRRLASATPDLVSFHTPVVSIDASRVLHIKGTTNDDNVTIRTTADGRTRINIISRVSYTGGSGAQFVTGNDTVGGREAVSQGSTFLLITGDGVKNRSELYTSFAVTSRRYRSIQIEPSGGTDNLAVRNFSGGAAVPVNVVDPKPVAQAGQTPSDAAIGHYNGSAVAWKRKLADQLTVAQASDASIGFFGDSHVERYPYYGHSAWDAAFADALNLGTSGDSTRQLLARIQAGLFDDYKPDTLVLLFGTNNFNDPATAGTDKQILEGMKEVIAALRRRLPDTQLVMISVLPRTGDGINARIQTLNATLANLDDGGQFDFLNVYSYFAGDPVRRYYINPDNHLNANGYKLLTKLLTAELKRI